MSEHYAAKLKRQIDEVNKQNALLIEVLTEIALNKSLSPQKVADKVLKQIGLIPYKGDADCDPDGLYFMPGGFTDDKIDGYL